MKTTMTPTTNVRAVIPHTGSANLSALSADFALFGTTAKGSKVLKPVSKKEFVTANATKYGTKSQAVKAYYQQLHTLTSAAQASFNHAVSNGHRVAGVRVAKSGRMNFSLFTPKGDTGSASSLSKENESLKAKLAAQEDRLAKLEARLLAEGK